MLINPMKTLSEGNPWQQVYGLLATSLYPHSSASFGHVFFLHLRALLISRPWMVIGWPVMLPEKSNNNI